MTNFIFPFGRPVAPRKPIADGQRDLFILGAYPSAFHVAWYPPNGLQPIQAIAVDNEPEPFWNGTGAAEQFVAWRSAVRFDESRFGKITLASRFNGSAGKWVDTQVLRPLGAKRDKAWITDCLDMYYCSSALLRRLTDTYVKISGLPTWQLLEHPSEAAIVKKNLASQMARLRSELAVARPKKVVTLGNAALRVFSQLVQNASDAALPRRLSDDSAVYERRVAVRFDGRDVEWLPLAHPAAPQIYQAAHKRWLEKNRAK